MLTTEQLKSTLHYNPETGIFTRLKTTARLAKKGDIAGYSHYGHIEISIKSKSYFAHRLAWLYEYGEFPNGSIDHINHIKDDNRICNLRVVPHIDNCQNRTKSNANSSGHTGVSFIKRLNKWRVQIGVNHKRIHVGVYNTKEEAIKARKEAEIKYGFHENHGKDK